MALQPATQELWNKLHAGELGETIANLFERWQDEKEYEDIKDYREPIQKLLPEGVVIKHMTRSPFGFRFTFNGKMYYFRIVLKGEDAVTKMDCEGKLAA